MSKRYWVVHISYVTFPKKMCKYFWHPVTGIILKKILFDSCDRLSWFNQLLICTLNAAKIHNLLCCFFLSTTERRHKRAAFSGLLQWSIPSWRVTNGNWYCMFSHLVAIHLQHSLCRGRLHTCKSYIHSKSGITSSLPFNPRTNAVRNFSFLTAY